MSQTWCGPLQHVQDDDGNHDQDRHARERPELERPRAVHFYGVAEY
jgi:hypothetical protein